jgi:hypothetical protein
MTVINRYGGEFQHGVTTFFLYHLLCNKATIGTGWGKGAATVGGSAARPRFYERGEVSAAPLGFRVC